MNYKSVCLPGQRPVFTENFPDMAVFRIFFPGILEPELNQSKKESKAFQCSR